MTFEFPEREGLPPVKLNWYEGHDEGKLVQPPQELIDMVITELNKTLAARGDKRVKDGKKVGLDKGGSIMVGSKGILYSPGDYGDTWYLLPSEQYHHFKAPVPSLARPAGSGQQR